MGRKKKVKDDNDGTHKTWEYTSFDIDKDLKWLRSLDHISRMLVSTEICPKTKELHLQGKMTFTRAYRFTQLKKLHERAHWSASCAQEWNYPNKIDSIVVIDINHKKQGTRTDLEDVVEAVKLGSSLDDLWRDFPTTMIRFHRGIELLVEKLSQERSTSDFKPVWELQKDVKSLVLHGKAGTGKTEYAKQHFKNPLLISDINGLKLFKPKEHDGIIFDDMSFLHIPKEIQIHIVDYDNPRDIKILYGTIRIPKNVKKIFTTNNYDGRIFEIDNPAISRRIKIVNCDEFPSIL
nr:MAG: replication associated protein [Cressdnaviricota sp.]